MARSGGCVHACGWAHGCAHGFGGGGGWGLVAIMGEGWGGGLVPSVERYDFHGICTIHVQPLYAPFSFTKRYIASPPRGHFLLANFSQKFDGFADAPHSKTVTPSDPHHVYTGWS